MDYIQIQKGQEILYGGNQNYIDGKTMQGYGCGLIAAADVSLHLSRFSNELTWEQYIQYVNALKRYFPILPHLGMNGWMLSFGLNHVFKKMHLPYRCHWTLKPIGSRAKDKMHKMLDQGIPVILTAGPNFPNVAGKKSVPLYRGCLRDSDHKTTSMHKHFVTITEMDGNDMILSSWGKKYHMNWEEYQRYARRHSAFFFTNYLQICRIYDNNSLENEKFV